MTLSSRGFKNQCRGIFEHMLDGLAFCRMVYDEQNKPADFIYLDVNDAFESLTGLKKEAVIGKKATEAIPGIKEQAPELFDIYARVARQGKPVTFETYFKPLSIWLSISVFCPEQNYFVAIFENISERKQMEQALRDGEQRFHLLFDLSNDGAMVHEMTPYGPGPFIEVNEAACQMLGYSREELQQMTPLDIDDPSTPDQAEVTNKFVSDGRMVFERTHIAKDGHRIPVEISSRMMEIDGKQYAISMVRDISERKVAKERLEQLVNQKTAQLSETNAKLVEEIAQRQQAREYLRTSYSLLEIANRNIDMATLLKAFVEKMAHLTKCSAVAIRLLDKEGNIPYQANIGFTKEFMDLESPLSIKSDACMCINVVKGSTNSERPYYTERGSFYMNATTRFLAGVPEEEKGVTRNVCNLFGYESVALIPIRTGSSVIGLIHLADKHEGMVPFSMIQRLENLAVQLGSSIERVWLTEALQASEEHFRSLYEKMPIAYQSLDGEGRFLSVNPAWLTIMGYGWNEVIGKSYGDFLIPEQVPLFIERFPRFKERGSVETEFNMVRKDGTNVLVTVTGRVDYDQQRNFKKTHCLLHDITEQRRAEEELHLMASFPIVNPNPVMRASPRGELLFANNASGPILESWHTRVGDPLPEYWRTETQSIFSSGIMRTYEIEHEGRFYDLKIFPDPTLGVLNLYAMDITRRKEIAQDLEVSEANYRMLFNNASDAMILWEKQADGVFKVREVNQVACQRYGYTHDEMLTLTGKDLNTPESYVGARRAAEQISKTGYASYELTHVTKDGRHIPSEVYGHAFELDGKTVVLAVIRDITERKRAEVEKARYQEQLEELVAERTQKLSAEIVSKLQAESELRVLYQREHSLSEELRKQIDERIFFTRALVHELKTPLTPLLGSSEILVSVAREEPIISLSRNVHNGALKLSNRIEQLLDLAKGEVGILNINPASIDMLRLVEDMVTYVTPAATKKGLSIKTVLPEVLPLGWGHREYLGRVMLNLLDNALKFTSEGGWVTVKAGLSDCMIQVEVTDTGRGISTEKQRRLFIPYARVGGDETEMEGLGLGLALCKTIVELHGGRIWIESRKDEGTTVRFTVPVSRTESKTSENRL